ncbi:MAG: hypothetical protein F4Y14_06670 [Acidobacteria bacterium]|nr:hypothetical protein [Acidobacteriota bacterium]
MSSRRKDCRDHPRKLLVEGETDKCVIPYLMEKHGIAWPDEQGEYPVCIEACGGIDEILKPEVIESELANSSLEALGVVVDANGDAGARWNGVRTWCSSEFADLPEQIPAEGVEVVLSAGLRFGVWIMPDNRFTGILEDFLVRLIPDDSRRLYELATNSVADAKRNGAPFRDVHVRKAEIHTWLAWQDPPDLRLHEAVERTVLDPARADSRTFVNWFRGLFRV